MGTQIQPVSLPTGVQTTPQTGQATGVNQQNTVFLKEKFEEIQNAQGFLGKTANAIKNFLNLGTSSEDCQQVLAQYQQGTISYEQALETLNKFKTAQDNNVDLISNILTGIASIAVATIGVKAGNINWINAFKMGAPIGAGLKTTLKLADRATNNVENDEWNRTLIAKDLISGAITGTTSAVSSKIGAGIKAQNWKLSVKNGTECGLLCGALSGSTNYLTNVAFDKDKKFNLYELIENTGTSAFISGTVGGVVGAGVYGLTSPSAATANSGITETIIKDSASSSSRKILGTMERQAMNRC